MTDTTFIAPSPWINDLWLPRDTLCATESLISCDLPFGSLDPDGQQLSHGAKLAWDIAGCDVTDWDGSGAYLSYDTSVANSECSEDVGSVDISLEEHAMLGHAASEDCMTASLLADTEALSPAIVQFLGEELDSYDHDLQPSCVSLSDWRDTSTDEDDDVILDIEVHSPPTPCPLQTESSPSKTFSLFDALNERITWSSLSESEQAQLVDDLSSVISSRLGIREQLEVVHVLKPNSLYSLTDHQFEIDVHELSDEKLNQVLLLLKQFLHSSNNCCDHDNNNNSQSSSTRSHVSHHHSCRSKSFSCHGDGRSHRDSSNPAYDDAKSKTRMKTPKLTAKQRRQQQRKRSRQDLKERRSGLFVQEQVLAVTIDDDESDAEDVDILA